MSPKTEKDFITEFFYNVINEKTGHISYNGTRHFVSKKTIEKLKPTFTSLEEVLQNTKPKVLQKKLEYIKDNHSGGLLPLALLIPLITGAIAAAGGVTGGVATAVAKAKQGQGIHCNEGRVHSDSDSEIEELKYCVNKLRGYGFSFV